jgi:hypothetical protein
MTDVPTKAVSRRKFLRGSALAAGAAAGGLAMPAVVTAQSPQVLRMQSSWTSSDIFQEMAQQYVDRVEAMSGGRLRVDLTPAGAIVGAFQVQDACHDGVLDCAHTVTVYWYGKHKAASLFGTGPIFGGTPRTCWPGSIRAAAGALPTSSSRTFSASTWSASSPCRCRPSRSAGSRSRSPMSASCRA